MFKNLLFKAVNKLKPEDKDKLRELLENDKNVVDENKSEVAGEEEKLEKEQEMAEKDLEKKENPEEVEKPTNKVDEVPKNNEVERGKTNEGEIETEKENAVAEEPNGDAQQQVAEVEPTGNGIRLEDLVTKDDLTERLSAIEAKLDAVIKENMDLKDKYENKDFGNFQKKGMIEKDKQANTSFEEYSKNFM